MWTPGSQLRSRPYLIESILGQGGFGITYKARHLQLDYLVALKTPNQSLQNDPQYHRFVKRFVREGQTLAQVCRYHQAIVRVSDLFDEYGLPCLVMDWVDGKSLYEKVQKRGALSENKAVNIIRQIGEALVEVHKAGIVHRDAHPGNIMLRGNGNAVLIDFGIATGLIPTVFTSMHPANRGFAPWEQWLEGSGKPTVDIYTLAASLYCAVTGTIPTSSEQRRFQNAYLQPARDFGVSEGVSRAIDKGMASEPERRPQSMGEWLSYLDYSPATIPSPLPRIPVPPSVAPRLSNSFSLPEIRMPASGNVDIKTTSTKSDRSLEEDLVKFVGLGLLCFVLAILSGIISENYKIAIIDTIGVLFLPLGSLLIGIGAFRNVGLANKSNYIQKHCRCLWYESTFLGIGFFGGMLFSILSVREVAMIFVILFYLGFFQFQLVFYFCYSQKNNN